MEYKCGNCKFSIDAHSISPWAGTACTRIIIMNGSLWTEKAYIVQIDGTEVMLIVNEDFLCKLWKPKEV